MVGPAAVRQKLTSKLSGQGADSAATALSYLATAGLGLVNLPILGYGLGADGRGELAAVVATTQLIGFMTTFGVPRAAVYFASEIQWRRIIMSSWTSVALFAIPFLLVLFPVYGWLLDGREEISRSWFYAYLAATLLVNPATTTIFWLRGMSRTVAFNLLNALPALLTSLGYVTLAVVGNLTLGNALASTFIAQVLARLIALAYGRSFPGRGFVMADTKRIHGYAWRAWFGSLSYLVTFRVDQFVLTGLVSSADLGHYAVAATAATLSLPLSRGISQTLLPHIRNATTNEERFLAIDKAVRWTRLASGAMLLLLAAVSPFLIPIIASDDFKPAVIPLLILLPGQFANDLATVYAAALDAFNRPEDASKAQILSAIVTIIGLAVLAPIYGIRGAAAVTSIAYLAYIVAILAFYRQAKNQVLVAEAV